MCIRDRHVTFEHNLILNLTTGDILVRYSINNNLNTDERILPNVNKEKKNDFKLLFDLV